MAEKVGLQNYCFSGNRMCNNPIKTNGLTFSILIVSEYSFLLRFMGVNRSDQSGSAVSQNLSTSPAARKDLDYFYLQLLSSPVSYQVAWLSGH